MAAGYPPGNQPRTDLFVLMGRCSNPIAG